MKEANVRWRVRAGARLVDCGTAWGRPDEVLKGLLCGELGRGGLQPAECYTFEAGDLVASAYGDEVRTVADKARAGAHEVEPAAGGYLFDFGAIVPPDGMARRVIEELTGEVARSVVRKAVREAIDAVWDPDKEIGRRRAYRPTVPAIDPLKCEHRMIVDQGPLYSYNAQRYQCYACGMSVAISDQEAALATVPLMDLARVRMMRHQGRPRP